jgi:phosphopantetheinyl transferase
MAAVVVSDSRCAVDIERADRDLSRVAARFFTDRERQLAAECGNGEVAIWCARECYYKFRRDKGLDILADICVTDMDLRRGEIVVEDSRGEEVKMKIEQTAEHIVVYVL